jgi:two-component system chemotaxis sensor kinase CheA
MSQLKGSRSLSFEMILWILLLIVMPLVILAFYFYSTMTTGLQDLEKEQAIVKGQAAEKMFAALGESILGVTITNGLWEDNRIALVNKDMDWLKQNIYSIPDLVPNINFVAEADLQGKVIIQKGDIAELSDIVQYPAIKERFKDIKGFTGLANTSKGLAILAVSPITNDTGTSEPVGMLISGRLINNTIMQGIHSTLQSEIAILLQSGQFLTSSETIKQTQLSGFVKDLQLNGKTFNPFTTEKHKDASVAKVSIAFKDMEDQPIGILYMESPSKASAEVGSSLRRLGLYAGIIMILLLILVLYLLRRRIIFPLRQFSLTMEKIASGAQLDEIPKNVLQAEAEIVGAFQKIIEWNQWLEKTVEQRTLAVRNLLDNAGQGFMSIGRDLIVADEHSVECNRIFHQEVAKASFPELLYPHDLEERKLLHSILDEYYREQDANAKELIFSLLPNEVYIDQRPIQLEYKMIPNGQELQAETMMIILTDISEKRLLENRMDAERHLLKMVVKVVTNFDDFVEMVREYEYFYQTEMYTILQRDESLERKILEIFKRVHTLKGNSGLLYLMNTVPNLHKMEGQLAACLKRKEPGTPEDICKQLAGYPMHEWLQEDIVLLQDILGEEFLKRDQTNLIIIDAQKLIEFEHEIRLLLKEETDKSLLLEIRRWRYRPIKSFFKSYPELIQRLADREGILIHPLVIEGGEMLVDPEWFQPFAKTLIHTLRNVIVHGIEDSELRADLGKELYGSVLFTIGLEGDSVRLTISDDGRGINPGLIRNKMIEKGICTQEAAQRLTEEEVLGYIFEEEFSMKEDVNDLAGRGIGLSAVKSALERIGGAVHVESSFGKGTTFNFNFPYASIELWKV